MQATTIPSIPRYIVMTAAAPMPSSCWGRYGRVAVVETDCEHMPRQIHPRHKTVRGIIRTWERRSIGRTDRCAFRRAVAEAQQLAAELNGIDWATYYPA